jgi:hypothetical protein
MNDQSTFRVVLRFCNRETLRLDHDVEIDRDARVVRVAGGEIDEIPFRDLKAVFFFRRSGEDPAAPEGGSALTIEFDDGEVIRGVSTEYNPTLSGFYLYPKDEDRVERVFVVSSAIVSIDVERL